MSKKLYLFANWKMYLDVAESVKLAGEFEGLDYPAHSVVAAFPSALAFVEVKKNLSNKSVVALGAQNTYWLDKGGYTGEVSVLMYRDAGARYALVGHAERRHLFHETNHEVRQKIETVLAQSMTPVLCVGETLAEKKDDLTAEVLEAQIRAAYMDLAWDKNNEPIVAYEPVWAIGTGESCEPDDTEQVAGLISGWVEELLGCKPAILYGGSVRPENISLYVGLPDISGVLVGGASAKIESWTGLVEKVIAPL